MVLSWTNIWPGLILWFLKIIQYLESMVIGKNYVLQLELL